MGSSGIVEASSQTYSLLIHSWIFEPFHHETCGVILLDDKTCTGSRVLHAKYEMEYSGYCGS